jgi:hypothetical protein
MHEENLQKKLLIHIGLPKTGTSWLQSIFSRESDAGELSYHYPKDNYKKKEHVPTAGNAVEFCLAIKRGDFYAANKIFFSYIEANSNTLISSEIFSTFTDAEIKYLKELAEKFKVKLTIVCYVRDVYDYYWSGYSQTIKRGGEFRGFIDNAKERPICIDRIFAYSAIGDMKIFHYDSLDDISAPFVELGVLRSQEKYKQKINVALTPRQMTVVKVLNRLLSVRIVSLISDRISQKNKPTPPPYNKEVEQFLFDNYASLIKKLNDTYSIDVKLTYKYK